jgi:hypothetical protein
VTERELAKGEIAFCLAVLGIRDLLFARYTLDGADLRTQLDAANARP